MKMVQKTKMVQAGALSWCLFACSAVMAAETLIRGYGPISTVQAFTDFHVVTSANWEKYATEFISFVHGIGRLYLSVLLGVPLVFFLHYMAIGPKSFGHTGRRIEFYAILTRLLHWACAITFSFLVITGIMVIFARFFHGGSLLLAARSVHLYCAYAFLIFGFPLFLIWLKDMFPAPYDMKWILTAGGYLSKESMPVPAGKFNFGQKMWFWLAFAGGAVMFYTGYYISGMKLPQEQLAGFLKIHLLLGLATVAFFITHLYMSLFAVKGSLGSMIRGYKWEGEVRCLHSKLLK